MTLKINNFALKNGNVDKFVPYPKMLTLKSKYRQVMTLKIKILTLQLVLKGKL